MSKYEQTIYVPKNPKKYIGTGSIKCRSSWERVFCQFLDNHPSVSQWASESIRIPYRNPLTGKNTTYVPDFFIIYQDARGVTHAEVIEIKPNSQSTMESAKSRRDKLSVALNMAKWGAARAFCESKGIKFRVVTEADMFSGGKK